MNESQGRGGLRGAVTDAVLDKVRQDRYPSLQQLDLLEQGADDRERAAVVEALLDKVRDERYPSPPLLWRLLRLAS